MPQLVAPSRPLSPPLVLRLAVPGWAPALVLSLAVTVPAWAPILRADLNLLRLFDAEAHLLKAFLLREQIAGGDWYPRWTPGHYGSYGYPTFTFYAPLLYYLMLLLARLWPAGDLVFAFRAAGALGALVLLGGVFALAWRIWRHGPAAVLCVALVAYAPMALAGNLLLAGALPQLLGLGLTVWLITCVLGLWQAAAGGRRTGGWWWSVVAVVALLLVTHNVSAAVAPFLVAGWLAVCWLQYPGARRAALGRTVTAGALGAALGAFVWVPALLLAPLVQLERMHRSTNHFRNWFIAWPGFQPEIWGAPGRSPWTPGWPFDLHLVYASSLYGPPRASLWQGVAVLAGLAALVLVLCRRLPRRGPVPLGGGARGRLPVLAIAFGLAVAVGAYALCFDWFLSWWQHYEALRSIQFPYRLLGPVALGTALAGAGALALLGRPGALTWLFAGTAALGLAAAGTAGRPLPLEAGAPTAIDQASVLDRQLSFPDFTASSSEFLPRTADYADRHEGELRSFWLYERMFPDASWLAGLLLVWQGDVAVRDAAGGTLWTVADVTVAGDTPATLAFHQLFFPGWRAWVDGRPAPLRTTPWIAAQAISPGFLLLDVPPGPHRVAVRFGPSGPVLAGALASLTAVLGLAAAALRRPRPWWRPALALAVCLGALTATVRLLAPMWPPALPVSPPRVAVVRSLAEAVLDGSATVRSPTGASLGRERFVDLRFLSVEAGDRPLRDGGPWGRRWLYTHPPAEVAVDLDVPPGAYFQTGMALDPAAWESPLGDGVEFVVALTPLSGQPGGEGADGEEVVLSRAWLNPRARGEDRRWVDAVADLGPWVGQRVRLTLRTDGKGDPAYDWAGWGEPAVVRLDPLTAGRLMRSSAAIMQVAGNP